MAIHRRQFLTYLTTIAALSALPHSVRAAITSRIAAQFGHIPEPSYIHRVISAGAPTDQLLLALVPEKLLGFSSLNLTNSDLFTAQLGNLPRLGRLSGRGSTLSLESLMTLEPDIIIDSGNVDETYRSLAKRVSEQTGIPYVLIDGTLKDSPTQLRQTGALLGVTEKADNLAKLHNNTLMMHYFLHHNKKRKNVFILLVVLKDYKQALKVLFTQKRLNYLDLKM